MPQMFIRSVLSKKEDANKTRTKNYYMKSLKMLLFLFKRQFLMIIGMVALMGME